MASFLSDAIELSFRKYTTSMSISFEDVDTYSSNDNELAGGLFIASTATPDSSCTLVTTNESCDENSRSGCCLAIRAI
jgi:hypothetical protein